MLRSLELQDYMQTRPATVLADNPLVDAVELIIKHRLSGVCVVDDRGQLVGVLSEMDCLGGILSATYNRGNVGRVREYMVSENLKVARPQDDIVDVAQDMLNTGQRRRPVVDAKNRLIGQITCRRILAAVNGFNAHLPG